MRTLQNILLPSTLLSVFSLPCKEDDLAKIRASARIGINVMRAGCLLNSPGRTVLAMQDGR